MNPPQKDFPVQHVYQNAVAYATPPSAAAAAGGRSAHYSSSPYGIKRPRYEHNLSYYESSAPQQHQQQLHVFEQTPPTAVAKQLQNFQIRHRSTDKTRGLRHFAHKVCEKVKEKGQTNYNEVADELVTEYFEQLAEVPTDPDKFQYDARNIRRRVYDALNVLMAMNIIEKEKKEIRWVGLPTSSLAECRRLEEEKMQRQERIRQKTEQLQELIIQLVAYKSLVQRNRENERLHGRPPDKSILYLPYIIVSTDKKTMVECAIAPDKSEYWFNFDRPFEIHDDIEVLKRLGLAYGIERGEVDPVHVPHIKSCLPPALRDYVDQILEGTLNAQSTIGQQHQVPKLTSHGLGQTDRRSLVKLDPNTGIASSHNEPIVVRATRANLSGIAPSGDGGPMGSFLGPVASTAPKKHVPPQPKHVPLQGPRYAVIPRPVSARYSSDAYEVGRYHHQQQQLPSYHYHHSHQQSSHFRAPPRLGGILHDQFDYHHQQQQGMHSSYVGAVGGMDYHHPIGEEYSGGGGELLEEGEEHLLMGVPSASGHQLVVVQDEEVVIGDGMQQQRQDTQY